MINVNVQQMDCFIRPLSPSLCLSEVQVNVCLCVDSVYMILVGPLSMRTMGAWPEFRNATTTARVARCVCGE